MKPKKSLISEIAIFTDLILIVFIAFVGFVVFDKNIRDSLIFVGGCSIVLIYRISVFISKRNAQRVYQEIRNTIHSMNNDFSIKIPDAPTGESELVYEELELLRRHITMADAKRQEILSVVSVIAVNVELGSLLEGILPKIMTGTGSNCIAFYLVNQANSTLEIKHSVGFSKNLYSEFDLTLSEGILGISLDTRAINVLRDIPDDTAYMVRSILGKIKPKSMMGVPIIEQDKIIGVLALASIYDYTNEQIAMMETMRYYLGVAVNNGLSYEKNKRLTNELKFQNKLIQDLNTDLENKVRDRTFLLNEIIDSMEDYCIFAVDEKGFIRGWSSGAENIFPFTKEQVIGKNAEMIFGDEIQQLEKYNECLNQAAKNSKHSDTISLKSEKGRVGLFEIAIYSRYGESGKVVGFTVVIRQISNDKKEEKR